MSRQDANAAFALTSFLYGGNADYIDDLYARYEADPTCDRTFASTSTLDPLVQHSKSNQRRRTEREHARAPLLPSSQGFLHRRPSSRPSGTALLATFDFLGA